MTDIVVPSTTGAAALDEVDRVDWESLAHAYGVGAGDDDAPHTDVAGSLRGLAITDTNHEPQCETGTSEGETSAFDDAIYLLYGNIWHQGTIYQATAYAVPFLVAYAAGDDTPQQQRRSIIELLAFIGIASSFEAPEGYYAGSWGSVDVGPSARAAIAASADRLRPMADDPELRPVIDALLRLPENPEQAATELSALVDD
ncbi:MAG: hypothetical protein WAV90_26660 [Gordonia amarae]